MSAPVASPARVAANRLNAQKATGPRTLEGKERARANAVKHGLTGAGIALPDEDQTTIEERFRSFRGDLAPRSAVGVFLTHQMALMSVRMERAARQEAAALACRMRAAAANFDEGRAAEVDRLFAAIEADAEPRGPWRRLAAMPEGVDRLLEALLEVKIDLFQAGVAWSEAHERRVEACCGRAPGAIPESRVAALSRALRGDWSRIRPAEVAHLDSPARRDAWAGKAMIALIDDEIAWLKTHRASLDVEAVALDRAEAGTRAIFDPGPEATLARRYEAAANRTFNRALRDLQAVEATVATAPPPPAPLPIGPNSAATPPATPKPGSDHGLRSALASFGIAPPGGVAGATEPDREQPPGDPRADRDAPGDPSTGEN